MRSLEGDGKTNAEDTPLAAASQPCQLGCAATANKSLLPAKGKRATGTLPPFRCALLLAASATRVQEGCLCSCHFSRREEHLFQLLRLKSSLYVIKCDL